MDNNIILVVITVTILTFIYGYIAYSIAKSTARKQMQKDKEMIEIEQEEFECFVCRKKYSTNKLMSGYEDGRHPLCSEKCVNVYINAGYNPEENNSSMWNEIYKKKIEEAKS